MSIVVKDLSYTYNAKSPYETQALKDVCIQIPKGQFVALCGHTGSGKTTFIQHLNALITTQQGQVYVDGLDLTLKNKKLRKQMLKQLRGKVGMVFQYPEYQLFEDTVAKDVAFGPKNMKLEKAEIDRRVLNAMEVVGLDYNEFASRSPFDLSGGEKRRVAIAGVIAMEPKILVLDEPVAGLDPVGREEILTLVKKLQVKVSPTIILVSHNMDDIAVLADRIIALKDGEIVADGTPKQVFSDRQRIKEIGLDIPEATKISDMLIQKGYDLPSDIVTMKQLKEELCALKKKGENADV